MDNTSVFVRHEPCPACGSKDNLGRWSDGHAFCFGCHHYIPGEDGADIRTEDERDNPPSFAPIEYKIKPIPKRGLDATTVEKWGYGLSALKDGGPCHVATYRDQYGTIVAQKIRTGTKDFPWIKPPSFKAPLYGMHLWRTDRRSITITEGELDALSVSQAFDHKYPVVSVPNGAQGAAKDLMRHYDWLDEFDKIVLCFDNDEEGRAAAEKCAELLPPGKVYIADIAPYKDANDALVKNDPGYITKAYYSAKQFRPDGVFTLEELKEDILKPLEMGRPYFLPTLNKWTYGRHVGQVIYWGAGTGIGKTDFFTQQIAFDVTELSKACGVIYLEQQPAETGKRIAGKVAGKLFHVPDAGWTQDDLNKTLDRLIASGKLFFGGKFALADWKSIQSKIRYMVRALGVEHIYLDHLTALADPLKEKESLEVITKELALLAQELGIIIHVISHLSTPEGTPHEEGGRVMLRHFKGSRAIGFWAHAAFGLERNPHADDPEVRKRTYLRCLKDRYTGQSTGNVMCTGYDPKTGLIAEVPYVAPPEKSRKSKGSMFDQDTDEDLDI